METKEEARAYRLTVRESLVGDRQFYKRVGMIVLPIIVQNTLSNVVSLLDNVMVGRVGTLPMSAVAISNQLLFVFYVCVFGLLAGAGIYGTQFFGKGDMEGVRNTLRFKIVACMILCVAVILLFSLAQDPLIRLYIADTTSEAEAAATLAYGKQYLSIMLIGLIPTGITQCVAGTMREGGKTILPMVASMTAMTVNFFLNLLLIFGYLGFPKMGVAGAAVATVISRFVEVFVIFIGYKRKPEKYRFMKGLLKNFRVPKELIPPLMKNAMPLLLNEFLWSFSQAVLLQSYSVRGIGAIASLNICFTVSNIFNEVFLSLGSAAGIVIGQELGANRLISAKRSAWRMAALSFTACLVSGAVMFLVAPLIPQVYNTENEIRELAASCIRVVSVFMPINALCNVFYFTLRSGGKILVTFLFDFCFAWGGSVPVAFIVTHFTDLPVLWCFVLVQCVEIFKAGTGFFLIKRGKWINNLVGKPVAQ